MHGFPSGCVQPCNAAASAIPASGCGEPCTGSAGSSASSPSDSVPACAAPHFSAPGLETAAPGAPAAGSLHATEPLVAPGASPAGPLHATENLHTPATRMIAAAPDRFSARSLDATDTSVHAPVSSANDRMSPAVPTPMSPVSQTATPLASSPATTTSPPEIVPPEPRDYKEALRIPHWRDAMEAEFSALQDTGTWRLVPPIPGVNLIDSRWIFKVKLHADGSIERLIGKLRSEFSVKDLGALHYFLGIEVSSPSAGHLLLKQPRMVMRFLLRKPLSIAVLLEVFSISQ
ncbi:hypothetical protein QYE76_012657 [Lolium multiflorum]|uniref:Reverse transcriptase Ty1/copia-type domain-containing protein n=1 Tax=Lolium multiflorum TaxID=4521 RepID=A0AAD8X560_LOLMU|nr:hypothetical protein QYE76_012657 [Lolium multiflorum]